MTSARPKQFDTVCLLIEVDGFKIGTAGGVVKVVGDDAIVEIVHVADYDNELITTSTIRVSCANVELL